MNTPLSVFANRTTSLRREVVKTGVLETSSLVVKTPVVASQPDAVLSMDSNGNLGKLPVSSFVTNSEQRGSVANLAPDVHSYSATARTAAIYWTKVGTRVTVAFLGNSPSQTVTGLGGVIQWSGVIPAGFRPADPDGFTAPITMVVNGTREFGRISVNQSGDLFINRASGAVFTVNLAWVTQTTVMSYDAAVDLSVTV